MSVGMQQLAAMSGWPFPPGTGPNIPPWMTVPHHQGPTGQGFGPDLAALIASGALPQVFPGPNSSQGFGPPAFLGGMSPEEIQLLVVGPGNVPPVMNPWAMFPGMPPGMAAQLAAGHLPLPPSLHGIPPEMLAVLANGGLSPNELAAMAASGLPDHMMPPGISPSMAAAMAAMAGHPPPGIIPPGMVESKNGIHPCPTK